ncbi:MAG: FeoB small GTPase domain-containing protein [Verrucomicrobiales bacterium]
MRLNRNSALAGVGFCTVSDLSPGCEGVISGFLNRDVALRRFREMGLVEGTGVRVVRKAPFRGAIEIAVRGARLSIRNEAASQIAVRLVGSWNDRPLPFRPGPKPAGDKASDAPRTFALVGNPNSGKTTLFNSLTGLRQKVGNYPGVTVERKEGVCYGQHGETYRIIDLPGSYSLHVHSPG